VLLDKPENPCTEFVNTDCTIYTSIPLIRSGLTFAVVIVVDINHMFQRKLQTPGADYYCYEYYVTVVKLGDEKL